jgi:anti-anti-sigma regulatory factor
MMLKISRRDGLDGKSILTIEGTLGGAWVRELRIACDRTLDERGRVVLDLAGVVFVDRTGAALLDTLKQDPRVEIESVSAFVAEMLKGGVA